MWSVMYIADSLMLNPRSELCQWLWSKLLRQELQNFMDMRNGAHMRKNKDKAGPSSMSRNTAFSLPETWGG